MLCGHDVHPARSCLFHESRPLGCPAVVMSPLRVEVAEDDRRPGGLTDLNRFTDRCQISHALVRRAEIPIVGVVEAAVASGDPGELDHLLGLGEIAGDVE